MDVSTIQVIIAGIVTIIGALATATVIVVTAIRTVGTKADVIVGHVNSEKTASIERERALTGENKLLREMMDTQRSTAALLAQAVVSRERLDAGTMRAAEGLTQVEAPVVVVPPRKD